MTHNTTFLIVCLFFKIILRGLYTEELPPCCKQGRKIKYKGGELSREALSEKPWSSPQVTVLVWAVHYFLVSSLYNYTNVCKGN